MRWDARWSVLSVPKGSFVAVIYCSITNQPRAKQLKTITVFFLTLGVRNLDKAQMGRFLCSMWPRLGSPTWLHVVGAGTGLEGPRGFHSCVWHPGYLFHSSALSPPLWLSWASSEQSGLGVGGLHVWLMDSMRFEAELQFS